MTANELLSRARALGIRLWVEGGRLRYDAPAGALSDDLRRQIGEHRTEIITALEAVSTDSLPPLERADRTGAIPLSFAQQRLWLLEQLEPGTSLYHTYGAVRIIGALDVAALGRSLSEVVRRHEALRTTFAVVDGVPAQRISPAQPLTIQVEDLSHLPPAERAGEAQARANFHRRSTFDLAAGPLIRVKLLRFDELEHVLVVVMHHIVCDGWSVAVITRELTLLYEAFVAGRPSPLPELPIQYGDFSVWQRASLQGDHLASQLAFWRRQLDGASVLELPTKTRPVTASGRGAEESLVLSARQEAALESLSRREGVTLFMTLLAAFDVLLARYARQTDIVVGVPVANRTEPQLEPLVGFFVNMLVMRSDLSGNPTFRELLGRVRALALEAYAHQETPFERIVEELQPDRESGRTPLFQVTFSYQNTPAVSLQFGNARLEPLRIDNPTTRFDLEMGVGKLESGLLARLNYSTDLFDGPEIQAMLRAFGVLLDAIVADPEARIARLSMIASSERRSIRDRSGDGQRLPDLTGSVAARFEEQAARTPDAVAVVFNDETLTYGELNDRANRLARHLEAEGVRPASLVGVALDRSLDLIVSLVAILKAGGAYVPLDPAYPASRLSFVIDDADLRVVMTIAALNSEMPPTPGVRIICLDLEADAIAARPSGNAALMIGPEDLVYVTYTSGSTGIPKGVEVAHQGVLRLLADQSYATFDERQRILQLAPVAFDASTFDIWGALLYGGQCVLFPERLPVMERVEAAMVRHGITAVFLTTSLFNEVVDKAPGALRHVRTVITGGEVVSVPHVRRALASLPDTTIVHAYGPTECTTYTTCEAIPRELPDGIATISIGRPIARTQVYFLDEEFNPVPDGMVGELCVGGQGVARGYLRRPDLTAEKFIPDPFSAVPGARLYRSGDLGRRLANGQIDFHGRFDRQIKIRGFRVELGEIEAAILEHPGVRECVVELRRDSGDKQLVAYVVPDGETPVVIEGLSLHLRTRLPSYMVPAAVMMLDRLPLNANGKLDRRLLPAPQQQAPENREIVAPRTALEIAIAAIWREVLGLDAVGIRDNFFDLGGHSLLLIRVHGRLIESLKRSVQVVDLFRHPTIESLARELGGESAETRPLEQARARVARRGASTEPNEAIAVIGMAGRFPGAANVDAFWDNLRQGVESIRVFSDDELAAAGVPEALIADPRYVRARGVLDGVELFDAGFFGYTPREAEVMDPQHRLFLECAWEALERSGYDPARYDGLIGVFGGANLNTYAANLLSNRDALTAIGGVQSLISIAGDFLPTRVSYKLNLRGPSVNVQTACSTSLVAVQTACRSLSAHDCDMALAGGVSITVPYIRGHMFQEGGIASPDGHTRAFDRASQGTVPGNGVGIVVLKRLADALADGDDIQAVIRGAAINNDGSLKVGFTAPGVDGQAEVVAMAQASAGVEPSSISYIEAHGTGTALGDPIEVSALTRVFGQGEPNSCAIGTLKTNVGHLDAAAGIAGLIKTVLALKHRELPPSLHFEAPNPKIDFASGPFYVNARLQPWLGDGGPRRAGVSSFGIGGTNAHVVLEEAPARPDATAIAGPQLIVLSARTRAALDEMSANLAAFLQRAPATSLADVAFTLQVGRAELAHRRAVVAEDAGDAVRKLSAAGARDVSIVAPETSARSMVFMFSGQGSQYAGMAASLYEREPVFRAELDACAGILQPFLDVDIRDVICAPRSDATAALLDETRITQPALFVVEYALARLLMHWGVRPDAMIGHSIGEYVAACLSGVLSLEDALRLVAVRARLMQAMPRGAMLAVALAEREIVPLLGDALWLAAVNAAGMIVVSGAEDAISAFEAMLAGRNIGTVRLRTSHAFHSGMMDAALPAFAAEVRRAVLNPPAIPFMSNVTGIAITDQQATDPDYWVSHLRGTVRFADGLRTLLENPATILLEVGPGASLASLARKEAGRARASRVAACAADNARDGLPLNLQSVLGALGKLWLTGVQADWAALHEAARPRRTPLPTYPFDRQRYWIDARPDASAARPPVRITKRPDVADWFYEPAWTPSPLDELPPASTPSDGPWLLFVENGGTSAAIVERLRAAGATLVLARQGRDFAEQAPGEYTLDPAVRGHYDSLIAKMTGGGQPPRHVVHLWSLPPVDSLSASFEAAQVPGFYSLLFVAQALGAARITQPLDLHVVTSGLHSVVAGDRPTPEKGTLFGLTTVIPQEYPHVRCSCVELEADGGGDSSRSIDAVVRELLAGADSPIVAYRDGQRWIRTYQAVSVPAAVPSRIRAGGVYLITGGIGGVGLAVAQRIAAAGGTKLVLLSRTPVAARDTWPALLAGPGVDARLSGHVSALQSLEAAGAEVLTLQADVADAAQMRLAFESAVSRFGRLDGVIHAAGVARGPGFGPIQSLDPAECEQQFRPKVHGLRVLADLVDKFRPDFCLLTSSLSSVLGGLGYAAYAAANCFMDAFAEARAGSAPGATAWLSVDFDGWDFAADSTTALAMTAAEGSEALVRAAELTSGPSRLVVSVGDLHARLQRYVHKPSPGDRAASTAPPAALTTYARPDIGNAYVAPTDEVERSIAATWQELLGIDQVGREDNFFDLGGHSLLLVQAHGILAKRIGKDFPVTALFEFPTIASLARHLGGGAGDEPASTGRITRPAGSAVAVIGMAGRFPGARDLDQFWTNLRDGVEAIRVCSDEELRRHGVDEEMLAQPNYVKAVSAIDDTDMFDASFFSYSPREAELLDPQHRVFLESAWQALEHAGCDPARYQGAIGVFAGARANSYFANVVSNPEVMKSAGVFQASLGTQGDFLSSRVSYKLNLKGPSVNVQTSCSTSLVAVHQACRSLLDGECDTALAGGVSIGVPSTAGYLYYEEGILSPDGHCRPFDAAARGTVPASGVGVVVLKRLEDALAEGDSIYAVVRGTAINNDGASKVGYTAPSVSGQASVIARAHAVAGVRPSDISYVEAHGTGTALGDPIEVAALNKAFGQASGPPCAIGTVKSNLGHLDAAAGVAGFIKTVLALHHRELPPSLHFRSPNPKIDFTADRFRVNAELRPWPAGDAARLAGVSSFGIGGTNAHAVLEEAPAPAPSGPSRPWQLLVLSAKSRTALDEAGDLLAGSVATSDAALADVAFTLQTGRAAFAHREVVVCRDVNAGDGGPLGSGSRTIRGNASVAPSFGFVFSELGAGYAGMARALYDNEPSFRSDIDDCCAAVSRSGAGDPRALLFPAAGSAASPTPVQPTAVFMVEYALARLLIKWGVEPAAMAGPGLSEYVAGCLAGVFSLDDALNLVAAGAQANAGRANTGSFIGTAALEAFRGAVTQAARHLPKRRIVSSVTGTWLTAEQATSVDYWVQQLQGPVRFAEGVRTLLTLTAPLLVEVGTGRALARVAAEAGSNNAFESVGTLPAASDTTAADSYLIETLGLLWTRGAEVDWRSFSAGERRRRVALPSYPFQRQRYWIERGSNAPATGRRSLTKNADSEAWFYVPTWRRSALPPSAAVTTAGAHWLIFEDATGVGAALAQQLKHHGGTATSVRMGTGFSVGPDGAYTVNPEVAADYDALVAQLDSGSAFPRRIVHLWGIGEFAPAPSESTAFDRAQAAGFYSVLYLTQSLLRHGVDDLDLAVIGDGWSSIDRHDRPRAEKATVLALCTVIPQEHPGIRTSTIEVDGVAPIRVDAIAERLRRELLIASEGMAVAYRGPQRWVQGYDPAATGAGWDTVLRRNGVYVITGGFGQVGLAIAERLAETMAARLVLVGRSALPDRSQWDAWIAGHGADDATATRIRAVRRLEQAGSEVMLGAADVADADRFAQVISAARDRFGAVHGIFHAAGTTAGSSIAGVATLERTACDLQFRPKVHGLYALERAVAAVSPDFCLLTSSLSSVLGGLGFGAYAAANRFMDAWVEAQGAAPVRWISANFDNWNFAPGAAKSALTEMAMTPAEGMQSIERILGCESLTRVVVSTANLEARLDRYVRRLQKPAAKPSALSQHARPETDSEYVPPAGGMEQLMASLWQELIGIDKVGRLDDFFDLGGHSLLATRVIAHIKERCGVDLPLRAFFEAPQLAELADRVSALQWAGQGRREDVAGAADREEVEI